MYRHAQIDEQGIVIGISSLSGKSDLDNLILINDLVVNLGDRYDSEKGVFISS